VRDVNLQAATALAGAWGDRDIGSEFRIDLWKERASNQNLTGVRAEVEFGFNATP
jgi:hypothetical protein